VVQGIARLAISPPRRVIAVTVLIMVGAAIFGIPGPRHGTATVCPGIPLKQLTMLVE
jgi:hypothetical protein